MLYSGGAVSTGGDCRGAALEAMFGNAFVAKTCVVYVGHVTLCYCLE